MPLADKSSKPAPRSPQYAMVAAVLTATSLLIIFIPDGWRIRVLLLLGMALGATLYLTSFSFTAAYRNLLLRRESIGFGPVRDVFTPEAIARAYAKNGEEAAA